MSLYTVQPITDYSIFTTPTADRKPVQFKATWATTLKELKRELERPQQVGRPMSATPTGIPVTRCALCSKTHPVTRPHCAACVKASVFLNDHGHCLTCQVAIGGTS